MPGINALSALQEQITKYIERNITILGECTKPLIVDHIGKMLAQIQNVNDGSVEKMDSLLQLLNNYIGQIKSNSVELIEQLLGPLFSKIV